MVCVRVVILGLNTLLAIVMGKTEDLNASGKLGGETKALNSTNLPSPKCEIQPETGYICCDQHIKEIILSTAKDHGKNFEKTEDEKCNIHNMAAKMQMKAEIELMHPYEAIATTAQFENEIHVLDNMMCKLRVNELNVLLYAVDKSPPTTTTSTTTTTATTTTTEKKGCEIEPTTTTTEKPQGCATEPTKTTTTTQLPSEYVDKKQLSQR